MPNWNSSCHVTISTTPSLAIGGKKDYPRKRGNRLPWRGSIKDSLLQKMWNVNNIHTSHSTLHASLSTLSIGSALRQGHDGLGQLLRGPMGFRVGVARRAYLHQQGTGAQILIEAGGPEL